MGVTGGTGMEADEETQKINEEVMAFLRKRSETNAPRYTARLKTYVDLQQKRRRAVAARRRSEQILKNERPAAGNKNEEKNGETTETRAPDEGAVSRRREKARVKTRGLRSRSGEPVDGCGCPRKRRRRSCGRRKRKRRRRSCRRRRRSCSRRRRRRSCRRRRRRRRRRRC